MHDINKQVGEIFDYDHLPERRWNQFKQWDRHSLILTVVGVSYVLIGCGLILSPTGRLNESKVNVLPDDWWYVGFMVVGAISIISSRWPNKPRTLGYAILTGWTAATAGLYILSGILDDLNGLITQGVTWALIAFLWWAISGLICPPTERGRYGVPSPHRDHCGSFDRRTSGVGHTTERDESNPNHSS